MSHDEDSRLRQAGDSAASTDNDTPATPAAGGEVPEGFMLMPDGLGFGDYLRPFYRRIDGSEVSFGFFVAAHHCNMLGICHGGALMTLADICAATSIYLKRGAPTPSPTISMSFDFQAPGRRGRWLHTRSDNVDAKRRFGFCTGVILDGETVVMRYSGTFYNPEPPAEGYSPEVARAMEILTASHAAGR